MRWFDLAVAAASTLAAGQPASAQGADLYPIWEEGVRLPAVEELRAPEGMVDVVVHRADKEFAFLHDNAVAWHGNTLFAAWYNCPKGEMVGASCIRGRRSADGGRTWTAPEVIAADAERRGLLYVPVAFLSWKETLFAFVSTMTGVDLVTSCEVFALDGKKDGWRRCGAIAGPFLPNSAPLRMEDGHFIMAGRMADKAGSKPEKPAVAISRGEDVTAPWRVVALTPEKLLPHERFPETTLWVRGAEITALVRGGFVTTSRDYGRTWTGLSRSNLPQQSSKLYAGTLSTGQRYLVWNRPDGGRNRDLLTLAVGRPGGAQVRAMWKIRQGFSDALGVGPEWSYPCAVEQGGRLYVIYTSEKKHSVMSIIPLGSLVLDEAKGNPGK